MPPDTLGELEPEERPAVRALAGDLAGARREAAADPPGGSVRAALGRRSSPASRRPARDWEALAALDP